MQRSKRRPEEDPQTPVTDSQGEQAAEFERRSEDEGIERAINIDGDERNANWIRIVRRKRLNAELKKKGSRGKALGRD